MTPRARKRRPWRAPIVEPLIHPYDIATGEGFELVYSLGSMIGPGKLMRMAAKKEATNEWYAREYGGVPESAVRMAVLYRHLALFLLAQNHDEMWAHRYAPHGP